MDSPRPRAETPQVDLPRRGAEDPVVDHVHNSHITVYTDSTCIAMIYILRVWMDFINATGEVS